jgi:hypothetical protein
MTDNSLTPEQREELEREERALHTALSSDRDALAGDYHMIRMVDALVKSDKFWALFEGIELPYTREELTAFVANRQAKRERIIEIRRLLGE